MKASNLLYHSIAVLCWSVNFSFAQDYDTIIIGAGWAGISAAKVLQEEGYPDFTILEARDRIGGRSYTVDWFDNVTQDIGSYYLTGANDNPLMEYIDRTDLDPVLQARTPYYTYPNGTRIDPELAANLTETYWIPFIGYTSGEYSENLTEIFEASYYFQRMNESWYEIWEDYYTNYYYDTLFELDVPMREIIDEFKFDTANILDDVSFNIIDDDMINSFFEQLVEEVIHADFAGNSTDMSLLWFGSTEWYNGSNFYLPTVEEQQRSRVKRAKEVEKRQVIHQGGGGFRALADAYAEDVIDRVQLEKKVVAINYDADPIEVTYEDSAGTTMTVTAKAAVVTVPIGVIKSGDIEFTPPLSEGATYWPWSEYLNKQYAIDHIGPGKILHCALYWNLTDDEVFWPNETSFMNFQAEEPYGQGLFTQWINFYHFNGGTPIIMAAAQGDYVTAMMDKTDEEVAEIALEKLRKTFDNVPDPDEILVHNWLRDEFSQSAYSYDQEDAYFARWALGKPLPGKDPLNARLHFAGEATSELYFGLISGAVFEGERAGYDVAEHIATKYPSCVDSPLPVFPFGIGCEAVVPNPQYCDFAGAPSHCPDTCGACGEFMCEDSALPWTFGGDYTCVQLAGLPTSQIDLYCETYSPIKETCRDTCGYC